MLNDASSSNLASSANPIRKQLKVNDGRELCVTSVNCGVLTESAPVGTYEQASSTTDP